MKFENVSLDVITEDSMVVADYRRRSEAILADAKSLLVDSAEQKAVAVVILGRIATVTREAEVARKEAIKPSDDWKTRVNFVFKNVLTPVLQADAMLRERVIRFDRIERERAEAAAKAAREAQEAAIRAKREADAAMARALEADKARDAEAISVALDLAAKADAQATKLAADAAVQREQALAPARTTVTEEATSTVRRTWDFTVTNPLHVPRAYLTLDKAAVRAAIMRMADEHMTIPQMREALPGIEPFQKESLSVTPR